MKTCVLYFRQLDHSKVSIAGGKAANLGELSRIGEIQVPEGFCITTEAYAKITGNNEDLKSLLKELAELSPADREKITRISAAMRKTIEETPIPAEIIEAIVTALATFDAQTPFAVRSSATAEDLPSASFAGQQDSYLNIIGKEAVLNHVSKCWASLFTDRAVTYRIQNRIDHGQVQLAVVVQQMVSPAASGVLFTADPITGHRKQLSIDAGVGLGDALVSGLVTPDNYTVRGGAIVDKRIATKTNAQTLTDAQIVELARIGRRIEAYFGRPQDIEWCLADDQFYIVQSRPITTLFPIPEANDAQNHVYLSVGHQQMMTDPMKPLGLSFWQMTAARPMFKAGGRLFVDVTENLLSPAGREALINGMGQHDPLIRDALITIVKRGDLIPSLPDDPKAPSPTKNNGFQPLIDNDPDIVAALIRQNLDSITALKERIQITTRPDLFDLIVEDGQQFRKGLFAPQNTNVFMTAINATAWINEKGSEWLGEKNVADILSQSVANNVTSEMGLELLDVADVLRPFPAVIEHLQHAKKENFLEELPGFEGGQKVRKALQAWLDKYGMRCTGEIDITRPRWSEKPTTLIPLILSNIKNQESGVAGRKFKQGRQEAIKKEQELLDRVRQLPDGEAKAVDLKRAISFLRNFIGYREYPKYFIISRAFVYKQALMKEAERLVQAGVLHVKEDSHWLSFQEFHEAVRTHRTDYSLIAQRKEEYEQFKKLTPPRVITSDGEIVSGRYDLDHLPAGAIPGLAVSSGIIEGRARVILNMEEANLEAGDILVTEVGGLMTHGAVIAREYGLPAVVGVEHATQLIRDGQQIRVNGTEGYVETL